MKVTVKVELPGGPQFGGSKIPELRLPPMKRITIVRMPAAPT